MDETKTYLHRVYAHLRKATHFNITARGVPIIPDGFLEVPPADLLKVRHMSRDGRRAWVKTRG